MNYHGIAINNNADDLWKIQELIHENLPERIIDIGDGNGGMSAWCRDCQLAELVHPFVIEIANAPRPNGFANYSDVTWVEGYPDNESFRRIAPLLGAPALVIINRDVTLQQIDLWSKLVTVGQHLVVIGDHVEVATHGIDGFRQRFVSESMTTFERLPINAPI